MPAKPILTASAILLALSGAVCLFMPIGGAGLHTQFLGAALMGFAALNWVAKDSTLGGIYGRPITVANFLHCAIASLLLVRAIIDAPGNTILLFVFIPYVLFALAFGSILFGWPKRSV
jgi:hypothetical protein